MAGNGDRRFTNRAAQIALASFGGVIMFIAVGGLVSGDWIVASVWLVIGAAVAYRALVTATVIVGDSTVDLRGFARTRRVDLDDLTAATVEIGTTGMNGNGREYLVLTRRDGSVVRFKELNAKPSSVGMTTVQQAARAVNDALPGDA